MEFAGCSQRRRKKPWEHFCYLEISCASNSTTIIQTDIWDSTFGNFRPTQKPSKFTSKQRKKCIFNVIKDTKTVARKLKHVMLPWDLPVSPTHGGDVIQRFLIFRSCRDCASCHCRANGCRDILIIFCRWQIHGVLVSHKSDGKPRRSL